MAERKEDDGQLGVVGDVDCVSKENTQRRLQDRGSRDKETHRSCWAPKYRTEHKTPVQRPVLPCRSSATLHPTKKNAQFAEPCSGTARDEDRRTRSVSTPDPNSPALLGSSTRIDFLNGVRFAQSAVPVEVHQTTPNLRIAVNNHSSNTSTSKKRRVETHFHPSNLHLAVRKPLVFPSINDGKIALLGEDGKVPQRVVVGDLVRDCFPSEREDKKTSRTVSD